MPRIDVTKDELLTLAQAAARFQIRGRKPHVSALWRWARRGVNGVRLEYVRVGARIFTTADALSQFAHDLAAADRPVGASSGAPRRPRSQTDERRQGEIEAAERELEAAGV